MYSLLYTKAKTIPTTNPPVVPNPATPVTQLDRTVITNSIKNHFQSALKMGTSQPQKNCVQENPTLTCLILPVVSFLSVAFS